MMADSVSKVLRTVGVILVEVKKLVHVIGNFQLLGPQKWGRWRLVDIEGQDLCDLTLTMWSYVLFFQELTLLLS